MDPRKSDTPLTRDDSTQMITFRPHHFLCTLGFEGKGYSAEFVRGFQLVADRLRATRDGDSVTIQVKASADSICEPCPSRIGEGCASDAKIRALDDAHASVLGLTHGQILTWGDAKMLIAERMTDESFEAACAPCSWKALGVCERALHKLKEQTSTEGTHGCSPATV